MNFLNEKNFGWHKKQNGQNTLSYKGSESFAIKIFGVCQKGDFQDNLTNHLQSIEDFPSGVIETDNHAIAWVDHIRSWPLFFTQTDNTLIISNNARLLQEKGNLEKIDTSSCLEFAMSGYVSGSNTLIKDLSCLQPGEYLIWDKTEKKLNLVRYHQYIPELKNGNQKREDNIEKLGLILDELTHKIINNANGRPIWIPLSGGLDSRIILCKLHEHGYKNLHTFTYGPRFNFESKIAKQVARTLNVPWHFISPSKAKIRRYFLSDERKDFWDSTDGLKAIPSMREFSALMTLREKKLVTEDAIFINGQSGDYITGNHISQKWIDHKTFAPEDLFQVLLTKHYDLWQTLKTPNNIHAIKSRIETMLPKNWQAKSSGIEMATLEEIWEYDARQICLVANGQKSYDYFGYDWEMPLWEKALVDFCETLPLDQKIGQNLYKEYLKDYNYQNLFPEKEPYIWRWPALMLWVVPAAQAIGIFRGRKAKDNFYALMRYHGHYSNQFYSFPWSTHQKTYKNTRNVMSLNVREWMIENKDIIPSSILQSIEAGYVD